MVSAGAEIKRSGGFFPQPEGWLLVVDANKNLALMDFALRKINTRKEMGGGITKEREGGGN